MTSDAQLAQWKAEADKLRKDAVDTRFSPVRNQLLEIAQRYDRLLVRAARQFAQAESRAVKRSESGQSATPPAE